MTDLGSALEALRSQTDEQAEAQTKTAEEARAALDEIRAKIKAGESTGDRLRDFALVHQGDDAVGTVSKIFHDLETQLSGKTGQLFVIGEYGLDRGHPFEEIPRRSVERPEQLTFGLLSDDKLAIDMQSGAWRLPCTEFVRGQYSCRGKLHAGMAFFEEEHSKWAYLLAKYGRPVENTPPPEIEAGDAEVLAWFKKRVHRFAPNDEVVRLDLVRKTIELSVPHGHWMRDVRATLSESTLAEALKLEIEIAEARFAIENPDSNYMPFEAKTKVEGIRRMIGLLGPTIDLAVQLGIDANRSEVLRMRENFGRYWKK